MCHFPFLHPSLHLCFILMMFIILMLSLLCDFYDDNLSFFFFAPICSAHLNILWYWKSFLLFFLFLEGYWERRWMKNEIHRQLNNSEYYNKNFFAMLFMLMMLLIPFVRIKFINKLMRKCHWKHISFYRPFSLIHR